MLARLARTLSFVFLLGVVITGAIAIARIAGAPHGADAATVPHNAARVAHARASGSGQGHRIPRSYTVRPGDTLSAIAQRCYGTATDWPELYRANTTRIQNPNLIYPGQVLVVPGTPAASLTRLGALAESGGNPDAISPTDDYGRWQINASHGTLATLSPMGNGRAAAIISRDGTDWSAWTTYRDGGFWGRC